MITTGKRARKAGGTRDAIKRDAMRARNSRARSRGKVYRGKQNKN